MDIQPCGEYCRFLRRRMASNEFAAYIATQGVAAVIAGLVVRYVGGREAHTPGHRKRRQDADRRVPVHVRAGLCRPSRRDCWRTDGTRSTVLRLVSPSLRGRSPSAASRVAPSTRRSWGAGGSRRWGSQVAQHLDLPGRRLPRRRGGRVYVFLYVLPAEKATGDVVEPASTA